MANIELLEKVLKHIEDNPESWNQKQWRCGTTYCFAGHAALMSGWEPEGEDRVAYWKLQGFESEEKVIESVNRLKDRDISWYERNEIPFRDDHYFQDKINELFEVVGNTNDVVTLNGEDRKSIADAAREALGIDEETADTLFCATNDLDDLRGMVKEIKINGDLRFRDWVGRDDEGDEDEES